jgi:AbrB family looped-hinge helix DNA binding protein
VYNNPYFDRRIVVRGEKPLATVTVSPKYQVVIPSDVRERLKLKPGQKVAVIEKDGVVHLVPIRPLKELKGMASGATLKGLRDEGDRR